MNVLAVFAHPDDEVLACGGTLAKHAEAGDEVGLSIGTADRWEERQAAATVLGLSSVFAQVLGLPDQKFETKPLAWIIRDIAQWAHKFDPDVIYTHHPGDLNLDHALTARAVLTAFRPKPGEKPRTILACEVLSSTEWTFPREFQPNWYEALTDAQVRRKIEALECYPSEVQSPPHPRSSAGIVTAAQKRGQETGVTYAEAFQLLRRGPF